MDLIFATGNRHKVEEINRIIGNKHQIMGLQELGFTEEIPETQTTIAGNAWQKADFIYTRYKKDCFADDTGLEINTLNGDPGVYSARYAGENCSYEDNVQKVLLNMHGKSNRTARFVTVICLIINGVRYEFEGVCKGKILDNPRGTNGFGYDSIFMPEGSDKSFAELTAEEKNTISHRGKAVKGLTEFLSTF